MASAIVIGSGIAGIASALRLNAAGIHVEVFESNSYPGGKIYNLEQDGYRFDTGPSLFTLPNLVDELFLLFNENPKDHFTYTKRDTICNYFWEDGVRFTVDANREVINSPYIDSNHFIARTDQPLDFTDSKGNKILFDLIISFEHFEHITHESVSSLMRNIQDHSKIGTHLIFTACTTEYPAEDHKHIHCNAQPYEYWIDNIRPYGFEPYNSNFILDRAGHTSEIFAKRIQ